MRYFYFSSCLALALAAVAGAQSPIVLDPSPARVVGQPVNNLAQQVGTTSLSPNFRAGNGLYGPQGVAVDTRSTPPILYVADTGNNRVLAWQHATSANANWTKTPPTVIGQPDLYSNVPGTFDNRGNLGLWHPTGVAVDPSNGNLYVVDSGNNRVVRYPSPLSSPNTGPDVVLGQPNPFTSNSPNQGGNASASTLYFASNGSTYIGALVVDSGGGLWVADAGNRRVLHYPAAALAPGSYGKPADIVLGQSNFTTIASPSGLTDRIHLYTPAGLAFDAEGHLFITDGDPVTPASRLLVFTPQFVNGMPASRLAGIVTPSATTATASTMNSPSGIVMINDGPAVADTGYNRLLVFDPYSSADWTVQAGDTTFSQPAPIAVGVLGQGANLTNFTSSAPNAGNAQAYVSVNNTEIATFSAPVAAAIAGSDLFVADGGNNRVLVYSLGGFPGTAASGVATAVLGQPDFPYSSPNSIQGSEFYFSSNISSIGGDAGMAVDTSSTPPHLYVSDPGNHRVLGFADVRKVAPGVVADLVIGQVDKATAVCNWPGVRPPNSTANPPPTQSSLCYPTGVAVDPSGNLYVADSGNGRVLRFPAPFQNNSTPLEPADLVLGQSGFTGPTNPKASQYTTQFPYGLVYDPANGLLVSDLTANRALLFSKDDIAKGTNGAGAVKVFGQSDFGSTSNSILYQPHHIAKDSTGLVYVTDSIHGQILIFDINAPSPITTSVNAIGGLNYPQSVWVNSNTIAGYQNDIWIGDAGIGLYRFPVPNPLGNNQPFPNYPIPAATLKAGQSVRCSGPYNCSLPVLALTQDGSGNLYVADSSNRLSIHYQALAADNGASFACAMGCNLGGLNDPQFYLAASAFGSVFPFSIPFPVTTTVNYVLPVPTTLGGVQVLVNGVPSPISSVTSGQINFIVPNEAPASGTAQLLVVEAATSQILGSGTLAMNSGSPGFFTNTANGSGQIAALNQDNTRNSTSNMAQLGSVIQLFGTGQGLVPNAPPDGHAATGAVSTPTTPTVYIGGSQGVVKYSGLAPGLVGLWQINVQIPQAPIALPGFPVNVFPVLLVYNSLASNTPQNNSNPALAATVAIKSQ